MPILLKLLTQHAAMARLTTPSLLALQSVVTLLILSEGISPTFSLSKTLLIPQNSEQIPTLTLYSLIPIHIDPLF